MHLFPFSYNFAEYHIIDTSRQELYPHDAAHPHRELMLHVWIPVTEKPCPLILFSHGLGDNFNGMTYTKLCQYCAAQGYVVASVSHTYGCKPIPFSDGYRAPYLFPAPFHGKSGKHIFDVEVYTWVADMKYALDTCECFNNSAQSLLYNKIDMSRIGVMGHSLGGATAMQLAKDNRIQAIVNLDGPLCGTDAMVPTKKPLMMILGPSSSKIIRHKEFTWRWYFNTFWLPSLNQFFASLTSDAYKITIDKIVHGTFSDAALNPDQVLVPLLLDGAYAHTIIHSYVGAFFDRYLKRIEAALLDAEISPWSHVRVEKK